MHRVFVGYHHDKDQAYKDHLVDMALEHSVFENTSVDLGDIDDRLSSETIRRIIRDGHLRNSTVTIVLVGLETARRKHVDWEIYSSMVNGMVSKRSGILAINMPCCKSDLAHAPHDTEKEMIYPDVPEPHWVDRSHREMMAIYPEMPQRLMDNLVNVSAKISVVPWRRICNDPGRLHWLVDAAFRSRKTNEHCFTTPMRRANS